MFETTEPVSEPRTTSGSPSATAKSAMISSGALPKLAFRNPPTPGPVCSAACSVASPISQASGISAIADEHEQRRLVRGGGRYRATSARGVEDEQCPEDPPNHAATLAALVIEAVLFDWNNTLVQFTWDDELLAAGHAPACARSGATTTPRRSPSAIASG